MLSADFVRVKNLPLRGKILIAPTVVLAVMLAMAAAAGGYLARQEFNADRLDRQVFEGLRRTFVATRVVTDLQTELYHLTSTAANETDQLKVEAAAARLTARLDDLNASIRDVVSDADGMIDPHPEAELHKQELTERLAAYDWAAGQMIEFTRHDAAYGVMMMGYVEESFTGLRGILDHMSAHAETHRANAVADLHRNSAAMRDTFAALVVAGTCSCP
jgi:hypothetical protein